RGSARRAARRSSERMLYPRVLGPQDRSEPKDLRSTLRKRLSTSSPRERATSSRADRGSLHSRAHLEKKNRRAASQPSSSVAVDVARRRVVHVDASLDVADATCSSGPLVLGPRLLERLARVQRPAALLEKLPRAAVRVARGRRRDHHHLLIGAVP